MRRPIAAAGVIPTYGVNALYVGRPCRRSCGMSMTRRLVLAIAAVIPVAACSSRSAGTLPDVGPPAIAREMRGIWVATVRNIDWPSVDSLSPERQRAELLD